MCVLCMFVCFMYFCVLCVWCICDCVIVHTVSRNITRTCLQLGRARLRRNGLWTIRRRTSSKFTKMSHIMWVDVCCCCCYFCCWCCCEFGLHIYFVLCVCVHVCARITVFTLPSLNDLLLQTHTKLLDNTKVARVSSRDSKDGSRDSDEERNSNRGG